MNIREYFKNGKNGEKPAKGLFNITPILKHLAKFTALS